MISPAFADSPEAKNSGVIYNSVIIPLPGNQVSQAFEAWQVSEFGNAVTFASGKNLEISKVVVTMSSCGYDSLNVALSEDPTNVTAGKSVEPGKLWASSLVPNFYADNGAAGVGKFRVDSPNFPAWWGVNDPYTTAPWYVPSIKVFSNSGGESDNQSEVKSSNTKTSDDKSNSKHGVKQS